MALTAQDMGSMGRLAQLAANPQGVGRDEIYVAVASLYRAQGAYLSERERLLMGEILRRLSHDVEMAVRIALAERLADDEDAPTDLILMLCDDKIEVARPIIMRSRKLTDTEILKFISDASAAHQAAIAARPNIGEPVTDVLSTSELETVLVTLVRNSTARIGAGAFENLVEKSKKLECLHGPLADRPDIPPLLAKQMCGWVSEALQAHITRNFQITAAKAEAVIVQARQAVQSPAPITAATDGADTSRKLVDKLYASGQLKAGFLLRVLHQNQTELFDNGFARILGIDVGKFRQLFYDFGPRPVAMACRAAGIDRAVFATVFNLSRKARNIPANITPEQRAEVEAVFNGLSKTDATSDLQTGKLAAAG
jgi:uncharacterized protein (DUF2336 family)